MKVKNIIFAKQPEDSQNLKEILKIVKEKKINRILLIATGALMNSTSSQQGETIPGIAHAIAIEN